MMVFNIKIHPYHLLFWTALVLVVLSVFIDNRSTIDVHAHDTYFVLSKKMVLWAFAVLAFVLWLFYWLAAGLMLSRSLIWMHLVLTIGGLVCLSITTLLVERFIDFGIWRLGFKTASSASGFTTWSGLVLVVCQLLFVFNFLAGITRRIVTSF